MDVWSTFTRKAMGRRFGSVVGSVVRFPLGINYLIFFHIFSFPGCSNKAKRGDEFPRQIRNASRIGKWRTEVS